VPVSIFTGGVLCVVGCGLCALLLPGFRNYDSTSKVHEADRVPAQ
jgi:hypothetical protein